MAVTRQKARKESIQLAQATLRKPRRKTSKQTKKKNTQALIPVTSVMTNKSNQSKSSINQTIPVTQTKNIKTTSEDESLRKKLEIIYKDVKSVPSYGAKITDFLRQHDVHGVYRRIVKKTFPRRRVIARFPFDLFMADLIEYPSKKMVYATSGYRFILVLIDCFTKKIYFAPMKRKNQAWSADRDLP